jgi:hypothetical protein
MRLCLRLFELESDGNFMPCVAKIFKRQKDERAYFDEALAQMAAECFAQEFNRIMQPTRFRVSFLPVSVIMLSERKAQLCNVEPQMQGNYVKHNDNDGHVETQEMLPQVRAPPAQLTHTAYRPCQAPIPQAVATVTPYSVAAFKTCMLTLSDITCTCRHLATSHGKRQTTRLWSATFKE